VPKKNESNILEFKVLETPVIEAYENKVPPQSLQLEMKIIGSILMNMKLVDIATGNITPNNFYSDSHQIIFKCILDLSERNEPIDLLTVTEELKFRGELEKIGGPAKLAEIAGNVEYMTEADMEYASNLLVEYWIRRYMIQLSFYLREVSFNTISSTTSILDNAQKEILKVSDYLQKKKYILIKDEVKDTMEYVEILHERHQSGAAIFGVPTGYEELDAITGGFQKSELIIIAGRPSHGKTALALNFARNAAVLHGKKIGIFSIEMSNRELALRFICLESRVDISKLKTGRLPESEWSKIASKAPSLMSDKVKIFIDDSSPLTLLELRSKARRMKKANEIDMIMVDYLQLMEVSNRGQMDRHLEIAFITRGLKQLAKELDIPVVALSQLSRKVEERAGKEKRPQLSDLRESGAIEQDADVVMFINRPEVFMSKDDPKFHEVAGLAEVIVGKQRNGPIGEAKLTFIHNYAKFENRAKDMEPTYYSPSDSPF
jgi:replicative DNA helicase